MPLDEPADPVFSRLPSAWRIGASYFADQGLETVGDAPLGLVDRLEDLASETCDTALVPAEVRRFFEDTASLELRIVPSWRAGVRLCARAFFFVMRRVGQFVQPLAEAIVETRIVGIDRNRDGRHDARGVVRTYAGTGRPMQIVGYATSLMAGVPMMNAAFPLPVGNLTGLLRLELVREGESGPVDGARLTSKRRRGSRDASGVWLVWGPLRIPMPLSETMSLTVASAEDARSFRGATIAGRHDQWLFGVRVVSYAYLFRPLASSQLLREPPSTTIGR